MHSFAQSLLQQIVFAKLGDAGDQLCHSLVPMVLILSIAFNAIMQQPTDAINCLVPKEWSEHKGWVTKTCYSDRLFVINDKEVLSYYYMTENGFILPYHKYMMIFVIIEAALCWLLRGVYWAINALPSQWNKTFVLSSSEGLARSFKVQQVITPKPADSHSPDVREAVISDLARQIERNIAHGKVKWMPNEWVRVIGFKLISLFLMSALAITNNWAVVYGTGHSTMPTAVTSAFYNQRQTLNGNNTLLPFHVGCKVTVHALGQLQERLLQCNLPINEWHLVMLVVHTAVLGLAAIITSIDVLINVATLCPCYRLYRIREWLRKKNELSTVGTDKTVLKNFVADVGVDVLLMLTIVAQNSDEESAAAVVAKMWWNYKQKSLKKEIQDELKRVEEGC